MHTLLDFIEANMHACFEFSCSWAYNVPSLLSDITQRIIVHVHMEFGAQQIDKNFFHNCTF